MHILACLWIYSLQETQLLSEPFSLCFQSEIYTKGVQNGKPIMPNPTLPATNREMRSRIYMQTWIDVSILVVPSTLRESHSQDSSTRGARWEFSLSHSIIKSQAGLHKNRIAHPKHREVQPCSMMGELKTLNPISFKASTSEPIKLTT